MSTTATNAPAGENHQQLAAEVLELGQSLFETVLEVGNHQRAEGQEGEIYPTEEIRAARDEFFTALRLLLRIEE
jgi:hypothetical protein